MRSTITYTHDEIIKVCEVEETLRSAEEKYLRIKHSTPSRHEYFRSIMKHNEMVQIELDENGWETGNFTILNEKF
jgi:hypothetical protein